MRNNIDNKNSIKIDIPIFRAKKIDSDEYVVGFYVDTVDFLTKTLKNKNGYITKNGSFHIIDISTLSIHFPDMLDNQGNKIFASLQEDGRGGDIYYVRDFSYGDLQGVARYEDNHFRIHRKGKAMGISLKCRDLKVIGIKE